jgi:hypothetical protein
MLLAIPLLLFFRFGQDDVSRWIDQLGSDSIAERDAAQMQLRQRVASETVRIRLEKVQKEGDPEKAARARELLSWFRPSASDAGVEVKLATTVRPGGIVDLVVTMTHRGREGCYIADPNYWNNWKYFAIEVLRDDGTVTALPVKSIRSEDAFRGVPPAKVPLAVGESRQYSDGRIEGLTPGTYRWRLTAKAMEGAKGYEGRAAVELPATKGAADVTVVTIPQTK